MEGKSNWLRYDFVMKLIAPLMNKGYHKFLYFDNMSILNETFVNTN